MRHTTRALMLTVGLLALGADAAGQNAPAPAAPATPKPCSAPEHRQFDFWLGDWSVTDPKGAAAGTNRITREHDGCVLVEHWTGAKGGTGSSFNLYDARDTRWHQIWVDNQGGLLRLEGGLVDGRMILEGPGGAAPGKSATNRIVWEKLPDGRVRQTWTVSTDGGATWSTAFDGFYAKR